MNGFRRADHRSSHASRPAPIRGVCVFLAAMAVAMLAAASKLEQPPVQVPDVDLSMSVAASE